MKRIPFIIVTVAVIEKHYDVIVAVVSRYQGIVDHIPSAHLLPKNKPERLAPPLPGRSAAIHSMT